MRVISKLFIYLHHIKVTDVRVVSKLFIYLHHIKVTDVRVVSRLFIYLHHVKVTDVRVESKLFIYLHHIKVTDVRVVSKFFIYLHHIKSLRPSDSYMCRRQAIIWTNDMMLSMGTLGTEFSEILIEIHTFSFQKMHLKMSPAKWRPSCLGLNVLITLPRVLHWHCNSLVAANLNKEIPDAHQREILNISCEIAVRQISQDPTPY